MNTATSFHTDTGTGSMPTSIHHMSYYETKGTDGTKNIKYKMTKPTQKEDTATNDFKLNFLHDIS